MRVGGRSMLGSAQHQWRLRKKKNRTLRRTARMMRNEADKIELSAELAMLLHDNERGGSQSPCSVVTSFSLSVDNRSPNQQDAGWIRRTVITDFSLMQEDRRSPLFTRGMLEREESVRSNNPALTVSQGHLRVDSSEARNQETSRLSLRQRLGPPGIQSLRRYSDITVSPERLPYAQDQQVDSWRHRKDARQYKQEEGLRKDDLNPDRNCGHNPDRNGEYYPGRDGGYSTDRNCGYDPNRNGGHNSDRYGSYNPDGIDDYIPDGFGRDHLSSPPRRSHSYRQSLYYPTDYSSPGHDARREPRSRAQWMEYSEYPPDNSDYIERPNRDYRRFEEFNDERFARGAFTPPPDVRYSYRQSPYYPSDYSSPRQNTSREPMLKGPWIDSQMNRPEYPPDFHEVPYNNERQNPWYDGLSSRGEFYNSDLPPQRSLQFPPRFASPMRNAPMNPQQSRPWRGPPRNPWQGLPSQNMKPFFYQDRFSDEDFTDSDPLDSETEEVSEDKPKMMVKKMWKTLTKERAVLVTHDGTYSNMKREYADYVKRILMEKAMDPTITYHPKNWRPRFIRTGLVKRSGLYQMICKDHQTMVWVLKQEIPPLDGHKFKILKRPYDWDCGPVRINTWLPAEPLDPEITLSSLEVENPGLGSEGWRLVSVTMEDGWRQIVADISGESALYLETNGWTIIFWNSILPVTRMQNIESFTEENAP